MSITMGRTFNEKSIGWNRTKTIPNKKNETKRNRKMSENYKIFFADAVNATDCIQLRKWQIY